MTARRITLRPVSPGSKRRGSPTKAEVEAQAQARQAVALLAGLDALTVSSQGRVSSEVYGSYVRRKKLPDTPRTLVRSIALSGRAPRSSPRAIVEEAIPS
jgi:hypothetical protein